MGSPLKKLRRQWGLTEAAGAAFLALSEIIGGLFITSTMATAPEVFKTWSVVRGGRSRPARRALLPTMPSP
jgi:hypothetical protein